MLKFTLIKNILTLYNLQGFALSSTLPLLTRWTSTQEQGLLVGIASAGIGIANSVTYPISGLLCQYGGWKSIFYFGGRLYGTKT